MKKELTLEQTLEKKIKKLEEQLFEKYGDLSDATKKMLKTVEEDPISQQLKEARSVLDITHRLDPKWNKKQKHEWVLYALDEKKKLVCVTCPSCGNSLREVKGVEICPHCQQHLVWAHQIMEAKENT